MRNKIMAILLIAASIVGCQSENSDETETLTPPPPPPPAVITGPNQPTSPATTAPGSSSGIKLNPNAKLNPPHGQPGHLCEIEVGAPLPASGAAPKTGPISQAIQPVPQANTSPITINPQPGPISTTPVTATAPGMNPPHGQPNHRCDIAVGAPLSSAPTKPN